LARICEGARDDHALAAKILATNRAMTTIQWATNFLAGQFGEPNQTHPNFLDNISKYLSQNHMCSSLLCTPLFLTSLLSLHKHGDLFVFFCSYKQFFREKATLLPDFNLIKPRVTHEFKHSEVIHAAAYSLAKVRQHELIKSRDKRKVTSRRHGREMPPLVFGRPSVLQLLGFMEEYSSRSSLSIQTSPSLSSPLNLGLHSCRKITVLYIMSAGWLITFFSMVSLLRIVHSAHEWARNKAQRIRQVKPAKLDRIA
jgi:hypothetical protein